MLVRQVKPMALYLPTPGSRTRTTSLRTRPGCEPRGKSYTDDTWFVPNVYLYDVPAYSLNLYSIPYQWNHFVSAH